MNEADHKRKLVRQINDLSGGYARRIEDRFAVGVLDLIFKLPGHPVTWAEGKLVDGNLFGPTERQYIEGTRILKAGMPTILLGWKQSFMFVSPWVRQANIRDCQHFGNGPSLAVLLGYLKWKNSDESR